MIVSHADRQGEGGEESERASERVQLAHETNYRLFATWPRDGLVPSSSTPGTRTSTLIHYTKEKITTQHTARSTLHPTAHLPMPRRFTGRTRQAGKRMKRGWWDLCMRQSGLGSAAKNIPGALLAAPVPTSSPPAPHDPWQTCTPKRPQRQKRGDTGALNHNHGPKEIAK